MTIRTLPLQDCIAEGYSQSAKYSVLEAKFGDGYKQVAPNGINNKRLTWSITYKNLDEDTFATVMDFIDSLKGSEPFYATPRGSVQQVWQLGANEVQITETAVSNLSGKTYRNISFVIEKVPYAVN